MRVGRIFYFNMQEDEIYKEMLANLKKMVESAALLEKAILELRGKKHDSLVQKTLEIQKECSKNSAKLNEKILNVGHSQSRQDLLLLNQALSKTSKAIEATAYRARMSRGIRLPDSLNKGLQEICKASVETLEALAKVLESMPCISEELLQQLNEVHVTEEKVDEIRRKHCEDFVHSSLSLSLQQYYIWHESVKKLEAIADSCDEAAEIIGRIIASKE
ncbi:MAG: DUF47 family protein [Candidatus Diapherotrites archaeon]